MSYIKAVLVTLLIFFYHGITFASELDNPNSWRDNTTIIKTLNTAPIISIKNMRDVLSAEKKKIEFNGDVKLVTLEGGIKAVFKACPKNDLVEAYSEVVAFRVYQKFGFPVVPPTIIRKINNEVGSLQLYVNTDIDLLKDDIYKKVLSEANKDDLANLLLFYFVFGQCDTGPHNLLALRKDKLYLIAIDNSALHNRSHVAHYGELPFVRVIYSDKLNTNDWEKDFPFNNAQIIRDMSEKNLKSIFGKKVPLRFYERFKNNKYPIKYIIYQNSVWAQYHAFDRGFVRSFTQYFPIDTIKTLQKLDLKTLEVIFNFPNKGDAFNKNYLQQILKRRDMVLDAYKTIVN